jgi:sugar (pentulose or hexulose) kinase
VVGVDIGTTALKAVAIDREGSEVATSVAATPFERVGGGVEMLPKRLDEALGACFERLAASGVHIEAIGIASIGETGVPLSVSREPVTPFVAWFDSRGETIVERLQAHYGSTLEQRTVRPIRVKSSIAKLGWAAQVSGRRVARWLGVAEYATWRLTGAEVSEPSLASRTGAYDVIEGDFIEDVLHFVDVRADVFPDQVEAGRVAGVVTRDASYWSAAPAGVPVTVAGHDHLVAAIGASASLSELANSLGSAELLMRAVEVAPAAQRILGLGAEMSRSPAEAGWTISCSPQRVGAELGTIQLALRRSFEALDAENVGQAASADERERIAAALGDVTAMRSLADEVGSGRVWRAAHELYAERATAVGEQLERVAGPRSATVFFGGAASKLGVSLRARALGGKATQVVGSLAGARGAGILAGVAVGWWRSPSDAPAVERATVISA